MKEFVDRRGNQWADWVFSGVRIGPRSPGGWSVGRMMGVPGAVSVASDPAATLELEFDRAVARLDRPFRKVMVAHYLSWMGRDQREFESLEEARAIALGVHQQSPYVVQLRTARQRADACGFTVPTFYRKLDLARSLVGAELRDNNKTISRVLKW